MNKETDKLFKDLLEICETLRGENGCMWDKGQTHKSLLPYLKEETGEVEEAINNNDTENLKEELGDLLYQIVFHSRIASESGTFEMADVLKSIKEKLIRRHPHVFSDTEVNSMQEIKENWDRIKKEEK